MKLFEGSFNHEGIKERVYIVASNLEEAANKLSNSEYSNVLIKEVVIRGYEVIVKKLD